MRFLPAITGLIIIGICFADRPVRAQPVNPELPATQPVSPELPTVQTAPPAVRVGDLPTQLEQFSAPPPTGPVKAWTIVPTLGLQELATDNVLLTPNGRRADLITSIIPGILINGDTQRLQATLNYAPMFQVYAFTPGQNNIAQQFNGQALATVVPDLLFINLQGFAAQQSTVGGLAPTGTPVLPAQQRIQTYSFTASPYLSHTFDGAGTAQIGYAFNYTSQSGTAAFQPLSSLPYFVSANLYSDEEFAKFTTGENLGRLNDKVLLDAVQNSGYGLVQNSYQNFYVDDIGYALTRSLTLLAEGGYEQIAYPNGLPPIKIDDAVWGGGMKLQPNADSTIIALYRHRYGFNAPFVDAVYALTPRTKIYANYSEILSSDTQAVQDTLADVKLDQYGNPVEQQTGAPVLLANQLFGVEDGLFRLKQLTLTATTSLERDTISLMVSHQDYSLVSISPGTSGFSQRGTSGGISWTHALTPDASSTAYVQYGTLSSPSVGTLGSSSEEVFAADLSLSYNFTKSLTGNIQYMVTNSNFGAVGAKPVLLSPQTVLQNIVLVGLMKTF
jgi:uncharacterized protein (PEP-CTERM system associated)